MSRAAEDSQPQNPASGADEANKFFLGARSALKVGDMKAAERLLRRSLELSPDNYNYMLALARLLVQVDKNVTETETLLLKAGEINVTAVEPRLILSSLHEKLGNTRTACNLLVGVLNIDPANFIAHRKLNQLNYKAPVSDELTPLRNEILEHSRLLTEKIEKGEYVVSEMVAAPTPSTTTVDTPLDFPDRVEAQEIVPAVVSAASNLTVASEISSTVLSVGPLLGVSEPEFVNETVDDPAVATNLVDIAMVAAIKEEIIERMPAFEMELDGPEIFRPALSIERDELGIEIENALQTLDVKEVVEIIRKFYFAVEEEIGRETAFLLMFRAKVQIESVYPALDSFEVIEDYKIIEFLSNDPFISARSLEALATWMYLFTTLLAETAFSTEASERAIKRAMPAGKTPAEELFIKIFQSIQI